MHQVVMKLTGLHDSQLSARSKGVQADLGEGCSDGTLPLSPVQHSTNDM